MQKHDVPGKQAYVPRRTGHSNPLPIHAEQADIEPGMQSQRPRSAMLRE